MATTQREARWKRAVPGQDPGALLVISLFFLAFFSPVIFSHKFFVTSDAFNYLYPLRSVVWSEVRHGRLPLWTPQIMSGYPLLSMAQIAIGYPLTWSYLFLPGYWAEQLYALAPYLLAPAFTYGYLRQIERTRLASLLGALAFGYGGFMISPLASYSGLAANAMMWLPLMLTVIERARSRRFVVSVLVATGAYAMSVLSGWGQGFVYSGLIALAYAVCMVFLPGPPRAGEASSVRIGFASWTRWRPLVAMIVAIILSAGLDAFQILETMQVQRLSIRRALTYELFAMGSYRLSTAVRSFFLPLHNVFEASAYVAPLVLVLAIVAVVVSVRHPQRDWRVFFWTGIAVFGFMLMLGENTPVAGVLYQVPPFNLFRGAARHAFEFTLAISVLSAYGWDNVSDWASRHERLWKSPVQEAGGKSIPFRKRTCAPDAQISQMASKCSSSTESSGSVNRRTRPLSKLFLIFSTSVMNGSPYPGVAVLVLALTAGILWVRDVARVPVGYMEIFYYPPRFSESRYLFWKLCFSLLTIIAAWLFLRARRERSRGALLLVTIAVACFFEPAIMVSRWWWPTLKPASRFTAVSAVTTLLQKYPAQENRIYTHVYPMVEEYADPPRLEPANLTMIHGLDNVAGNEPLILERYSRALGDVYIDAVKTRPGYPSDPTLLTSPSHVLDLLNNRFLVSYSNLATEPATPIERDGIRFDSREMDMRIDPGQSVTLKGAAAEADALALVTATAWSAEAVDGIEVARLRLVSPEGRTVEIPLRLGVDTAEWAHERANVRDTVRHSLAPVFSTEAADPNDPEPAYRFIARFPLPERMRVDHIEITNVSPSIVLLLSKATLFDSASRFSMPLPHYDLSRWQPIYDRNGALVLRNDRALPRAWLVAEAEAVEGEEALRRIRGQGKAFDPRRTALVEAGPHDLPDLPGGQISSAATARIVAHEKNRMVIDTNAETASILIVSEVNYPGWVATVDGSSAAIHTTDYLLRGVPLAAGGHRVEMRYTAPAARKGALISVFTIMIIVGLFVYAQRGKISRRGVTGV